MKSIQALEREIINSFEALSTVDEKYTLLFQLGEDLPPMDPDLKIERNQVKGCQSSLWFHLSQAGGRFHLHADSDSMVIKGIAALLVRLVEGRTAEEIQTINMDFIDQIKVWKLASERNNGLMSMLDHIHSLARIDPKAQESELPNLEDEDKFKSV